MDYSFKYESKDNKAFIFMLFFSDMFFNISFYLFGIAFMIIIWNVFFLPFKKFEMYF